ncbi:MAG TPA: PgaD family protein [Herbaspirillum sp.]|jgi:poly-beta-1,6-N-acetyl-D-glucosamine biosynthesis protein PgaD
MAQHPLARLRDGLFFMLCWAMWGMVLAAIINATEWETLGISAVEWLAAHRIFFNVLMASFHFPVAYLLLVAMLVCLFLIWSNLGMLLALRTRDLRGGLNALSLEDLVRHFGLDSTMIGPMQKEAQVIVFHAPSGAVTGVSRAACSDAKPLRLVV